MRIFTDSVSAAAGLIGPGVKWQQVRTGEADRLASVLFPGVSPLFTGDFPDKNWRILFISSHARESQFELLCRLLRANELQIDSIICCALSGENFKGYRNRSWISIEGNLHLSVFFKPDAVIKNFEVGFTIAAAVALIQTIDDIPSLSGRSTIKWVNDVLINSAKVGGVITQTQVTGERINGVVIGLGLNVENTPRVEQDIFVPQVTSLSEYTHCKRQDIFNSVIRHLYDNYLLLTTGQYQQLLEIYRKRSAVLGQHVRLYTDPFTGDPELITEGIISQIGSNLELYFEDRAQPFYRGRLVLDI